VAVRDTAKGDRLRVNLERGTVENLTSGKVFEAQPFPEFMREIISLGGLVDYVRKRLEGEG
jgi:3-isopropylmalate/(R)-2-methylmalate dehydratase small subunit